MLQSRGKFRMRTANRNPLQNAGEENLLRKLVEDLL
jgi:hypothetical protein